MRRRSGLAPGSAALEELFERLPQLSHLNVRGLMTVPPYLRDAEAVRPYFRRLRELRDKSAQRHPKFRLDALSMGMTHDECSGHRGGRDGDPARDGALRRARLQPVLSASVHVASLVTERRFQSP